MGIVWLKIFFARICDGTCCLLISSAVSQSSEGHNDVGHLTYNVLRCIETYFSSFNLAFQHSFSLGGVAFSSSAMSYNSTLYCSVFI